MPDGKVFSIEGLTRVLETARQIDSPRLDLGGFFDHDRPLYVDVTDLHTALSKEDSPEVSLHWDGDKTLLVKRTDGGVMATFELTF